MTVVNIKSVYIPVVLDPFTPGGAKNDTRQPVCAANDGDLTNTCYTSHLGSTNFSNRYFPGSPLDFLQEAIHEMRGYAPSEIREGIFYPDFQFFRRKAIERLKALDDRLSPALLTPKGEMTLGQMRDYERLPRGLRSRVDAIRWERHYAVATFTEEHAIPYQMAHLLPRGLLDEPFFFRQEHPQTGAIANYRMLMRSITGHLIAERTLRQSLPSKHEIPNQQALQRLFFNTLQTQAFKKRFHGVKVHVSTHVGTSLKQLGRIISHTKAAIPNTQTFVVMTVASETSRHHWQTVMLICVDEHTVTVHDPSNLNGQALRILDKKDFIRRWTQAGGMRTQLIFAYR